MKRNGTATEWGRVRAGVLTGRGPASREKARHDRRCSLSAASVVTSPPREQSRAELAEGQRRMQHALLASPAGGPGLGLVWVR